MAPPSLTKPRPVLPILVRPSEPPPRAEEPRSPTGIDAVSNATEKAEVVSSEVKPATRLRRPIGVQAPPPQVQAPTGPPAPARLQLLAEALATGGRAASSGLRAAWAIYSRLCLAAQNQLVRLATRSLAQGRVAAAHAGSTLSHLAGLGARGLKSGLALVWAGTTIAATASWNLAIRAVGAGGNGLASARLALIAAGQTSLPALAAVSRSMRSALASGVAAAERLPNAISQKRAIIAKAISRVDAARKDRPSPTSTPSSSAVPAPSSVQETTPAATKAEPAKASLVSILRSIWRGPAWMAVGGLAAASIATLVVAFGPYPPAAPARAALTVPLPIKPVLRPDASKPAASPPTALAADSAAKDERIASGPSDALSDPLADMVAYVGGLRSASAADGTSALAGAGAIDGLGRFLEAADVVGLERLLEPGGDYTIFVPNDAAFAQLAPGAFDRLLEPSGHERLLTLLSHHVVAERLTVDDFAGSIREVTSLAGRTVLIDATDAVRIGDAGMVEADLPAENGVLHVIDRLLALAEP